MKQPFDYNQDFLAVANVPTFFTFFTYSLYGIFFISDYVKQCKVNT